jgi:hypothetical protein
MACEIRSRSPRRDCRIGSWCNCYFIYSYRQKLHGVRSGDLGGPVNGFCSSYPSLLHLRRHIPLEVIRAQIAANMLQCYQRKCNESPCCFKVVSFLYLRITASKIHKFFSSKSFITALYLSYVLVPLVVQFYESNSALRSFSCVASIT